MMKPHPSSRIGCLRGVVPAICTWLVVLGLAPTTPAEELTGEQIYRQQCAWCHGDAGEGTEDFYSQRLEGDRSIDQLTRLIDRTMPQDDPEQCVDEDARKVAEYIYDAFYSPLAQARNRPARIELSRLTVRQYRNAVTDLVGSFRGPAQPAEGQGLKGQYYNARSFRRGGSNLERIDPEVRFNFGTDGPKPGEFNPNEFSIRWEGTVLAPETGVYEFVVQTEHAARLWVNDLQSPLIDAWVKSGDDTEYRATIPLLGGRRFALRLEFSKSKQGVDDKKDRTDEKIPASMTLLWKPPGRIAEVIPARNLSPGRASEIFVVTAPFPPDDRSIGYERGTSVSKAWAEATTEAAIETAGYVADELSELAGIRRDESDREKRVRDFCRAFAERAFRRPLTDEQARLYIDRQFAEAPDLETAVKRVVLLVLKSPRFLYRELSEGPPDAYDVASRLSFGLWDSLPDAELLKAAAAGQLATHEQVAEQARRMVPDDRTRAKVHEFLLQWLRVEGAPDIAKAATLFPDFDEALIADLRTSLELFLEDVVWGDDPDFRRLLLDEPLFLNGRLARFYGAELPEDAPFRKVTVEPGDRAGILTHPYLLATFAYTEASSPIHRGVFLLRSVLGRALRPPPAAFSPLAADLHPFLTTRERVVLQTEPESCMSCHEQINPLGFSLEAFDAVGRFRTEEKGKPIDATGQYQTLDGQTVTFAGARELATYLAGSPEPQSAFAEQLFHYLVKQPIRAYGPEASAELRQSFNEHDANIRELLIEIMARSALAARKDSSAEFGMRNAE